MKDKILILGGNGFIGQHVTKKAIIKGYDIYNLSLFNNNVLYNKDKVHNYFIDILDIDQIKENQIQKNNFKYIINCLGVGDHSSFLNGGLKIIKTHYICLLNILEIINWNSLEGFIQLDTSDVYGDYPAAQVENLREKSISPYSASKTAATHLLQMLYRSEGFPAKILRLFLPYGPGQSNNMLIPQVIIGCLKNDKFPVSLGEQYRDFIYIKDLVDSIFIALDKPKANGEVINIGYGQPIKVKTIIYMIKDMIGSGLPQFGKYPYRYGENMSLYPNIDKAKKILNWRPETFLEDGLKKTIKFYRKLLVK